MLMRLWFLYVTNGALFYLLKQSNRRIIWLLFDAVKRFTRRMLIQQFKALKGGMQYSNQVCVQPPTSAVNVTLPACDAELRAACARCCWAPAPAARRPQHRQQACCSRSISPVRRVLSSKPHVRRCCGCCWSMGRTDRRTIVSLTLLRILCGQHQWSVTTRKTLNIPTHNCS